MEKCEMFCYQCQETARGTGCTKVGVCGKKPELSGMLDLLVYVTKGLSCVTTKIREEGKEVSKDVNHLVTVNLFTTITNANFDRDAIIARIKETLAVKEELRKQLASTDALPAAALWNGDESEFDAKADSDEVGVLATENEDIRSDCFGYDSAESIVITDAVDFRRGNSIIFIHDRQRAECVLYGGDPGRTECDGVHGQLLTVSQR